MRELRPADYRAHWDEILPGLVEALKQNREGLRPEDVFADLKTGMAALYLCEDGFVIFKVTTDSLGRRELLIAWAYSQAHEKVIGKYADDVDSIARGLNCSTQILLTTRRGYERALPEGWMIKHICWTRSVPVEGD